jgi:hypothetical protein
MSDDLNDAPIAEALPARGAKAIHSCRVAPADVSASRWPRILGIAIAALLPNFFSNSGPDDPFYAISCLQHFTSVADSAGAECPVRLSNPESPPATVARVRSATIRY